MDARPSDLRTGLSKAKGLGAAKHGVEHWWLQRVTAVALVPLSAWFVYSLITVMLARDIVSVSGWFTSPINTIVMILMLVALFLHAKLGVQVVIEDYVKHPVMKYGLLLASNFACFAFAAVCIVAVLRLHFLDIAAGGL